MLTVHRFIALLALLAILAAPSAALCADATPKMMLPVRPRPQIMAQAPAGQGQNALMGVSVDGGKLTAGVKPQEALQYLPSTDMFLYVLDNQQAISLGLAFMSASHNAKISYVVQEFAIYREENSSDGVPQRVGVSIRLIIRVNEHASKLSTLGLAQMAFGVEDKKLEAHVRMQVNGIQSKNVTSAFVLPTELNFTSLSALYKAVDEVKKQIWDDSTRITTMVLGEVR